MFDTHKLNEEGFKKVSEFKVTMANAVREAISMMPEGREKAIFNTKLEEAVFFGTKAIASSPDNHSDKTEY